MASENTSETRGTAGAYVASKRRRLGLTQEQLAQSLSLSLRQLQRIEQGSQSISPKMVDALAMGMGLVPRDREHLHHLALGEREVVPLEIPEEDKTRIEALNPHLAGVVDWNWNVLAANRAYLTCFPGLGEWENVLLWFLFDERSKTAMVEWEAEAILTIRWWKHSLVLYGDNDDSKEIMAQARESAFFRQVWADEEIEAERTQDVMLIREGERISQVYARLYTLPIANGTLYYLGIRL